MLWDHFTSPVEWMNLLLLRYDAVVAIDSQIEKLRTFNLLKKWIESAASRIDWDNTVISSIVRVFACVPISICPARHVGRVPSLAVLR
jgi:hypothetical protein